MTFIFNLIVLATALLSHAAPQVSSDSSESTAINAPIQQSCSYVGGSQCCNSVDVISPEELNSLISVVNVVLDSNTLVGHGCSPLLGLDANCNAQAVCCEDSYGAIFIGCNNIIL